MIEKWARIPVAACVIAVLAVTCLLIMVAAPFVPMMAGPTEAHDG